MIDNNQFVANLHQTCTFDQLRSTELRCCPTIVDFEEVVGSVGARSGAMAGLGGWFRALKGGGARPNLFSCKVGFPAYALGGFHLSWWKRQIPSSQTGLIVRGRQLKIAGDRTFELGLAVINDTDFTWRNGTLDEQYQLTQCQHGCLLVSNWSLVEQLVRNIM